MASTEQLVHADLSDLTDGQLWMTLIRGVVIGVPLAFVLTLIVVSFVATWPGALLIALWAAVVAGPFSGAVAALIVQAARESRALSTSTQAAPQHRLRFHHARIA